MTPRHHPAEDVLLALAAGHLASGPALVVKSVFQTAAFAGYPNVSFMVGKLPKSSGSE